MTTANPTYLVTIRNGYTGETEQFGPYTENEAGMAAIDIKREYPQGHIAVAIVPIRQWKRING